MGGEYGACRAAGAPGPVNGKDSQGEFWMVGLGRKLLLVRHFQASGQELDATLTEVGTKQAETLAGFLSDMGVDKIVSHLPASATEHRAICHIDGIGHPN